MSRTLTFKIFRFDPTVRGDKPRMQEYKLQETPGMTLFIALNKIREEQDKTLKFDFVCRAAICGSCAMLIDGRPGLACKTLLKTKGDTITLMPLPVFKLLGDLSVDTGTWFRDMVVKTESWIHTAKKFDPKQEEKMDNKVALDVYEADRCIECGCCIGGCATVNIREDFLSGGGINRVARFMLDPRDERSDADYYEIIGNEEGAFGCVGLMACEDNCPMELPLQKHLAYARRKMASVGRAL